MQFLNNLPFKTIKIWVRVQCGKVSQERWESRLIFWNNSTCPLQLAAEAPSGGRAGCSLSHVANPGACSPRLGCVWAPVTRVLSCHFQSEPGWSQSQRGLPSDASPFWRPAVSSLLCQERERERDVEDWESLQELSMLAFKIEINKNNGKVYGICAVSFALEMITIVICISKWESSYSTLGSKKKKEKRIH